LQHHNYDGKIKKKQGVLIFFKIFFRVVCVTAITVTGVNGKAGSVECLYIGHWSLRKFFDLKNILVS
jgi:hypothetical protein